MKIASGSVDLGKAYSGFFVFHLSVFPDDSNLERGSFFSEEYCLTHLFPVFLESLYQEPGKLHVPVFAFPDPA